MTAPMPPRTHALLGVLVLAASWTLTAGCSTTTVSMRPAPRSFTASDYDGVYRAWTRGADEFAFGRLSDVLNVTATFQSWEFRWAYVVRYAEDHGLRTEERAEMLRATLADSRERHRFFVTLSGPRWREGDLTGDDSIWRVVLVDERGEQTVPIEIELVERPGTNISSYYPSVSPFRHTFRIVFPAKRADNSPTIPDSAKKVMLRFMGPLGQVELTWDLE